MINKLRNNKMAVIVAILFAILGIEIILVGEIGHIYGGRVIVPEQHRAWVGSVCIIASLYTFYLILRNRNK
jgi:hypothetical protein